MTPHLTHQQQEDYLLNQRSPSMLQHLAACPACREAVAHLQQTLSAYRAVAVEYTAQTLATRPRVPLSRPRPALDLRWALAALLPLLLLMLALLPFHFKTARPAQPGPALSDDALLEQVDEQLSTAVPSSMESLTHLVSTTAAATPRSKPLAQSN